MTTFSAPLQHHHLYLEEDGEVKIIFEKIEERTALMYRMIFNEKPTLFVYFKLSTKLQLSSTENNIEKTFNECDR